MQHQKPSSWGGPQYTYSPNSFSRGRTPDFSTRPSSGYQSRGSISNISDNIDSRQTNDSETMKS